ncbi:Putative calcineurin-like phosphoesterase domain, ApaH type, metallo-dependent phosphatase [Septoria linicola]|uniref:Calcineurin-like phosphoesterase domain, ApaH type, metallo-dependent phosphatase n=1 Tax=Septoria linicola TaxID=215465 RepID=A0A9Q9AT36_9PEZI|nr:putative calcineurin-like phosphoesterase domain, ApaH type, metallo-dependent phosphatase [Septoria linicola]USW55312.1 Putative calcineurin-like phosphoesterase domain, ApaH type, metallo-dependent phosphatase [Septoria linicola]
MAISKLPRNPYTVPSLYLQLLSPLKLLTRILDLLFSLLRPHNPTRKNITLVCISDTHTLIPQSLPYGDILIHAGDLTNAGTPKELQAQINYLHSLPHKHKIVIAGNHDSHLDPRSRGTLKLSDRNEDIDWRSLIYLQDSHITLTFPNRASTAGSTCKLKIYGSPVVPRVGGPEHAFQHPRSQDYWTGKVPNDVDVLVTHCPPMGHLDLPGVQAMGDEFLLHAVRRTKPRVHVFGHIHAGRSDGFGKAKGGSEVVRWDRAERHLAEILRRESAETLADALFKFCNLVLWYHFMAFIYWSLRRFLGEGILGRDESPSTTMVNAALMYEDEGRLGNSPQVVHI